MCAHKISYLYTKVNTHKHIVQNLLDTSPNQHIHRRGSTLDLVDMASKIRLNLAGAPPTESTSNRQLTDKLFHEDETVAAFRQGAGAKLLLLHVLRLVGEIVLVEILLVVAVVDEFGVLELVQVFSQLRQRMDC